MSWLTGYELENLVYNNADDKTQKAFLGIFAIDGLPQQIPHLPALLIINTHTSNLAGEHWKAVYISQEHCGEVFDSLAQPTSTRLLQWMNCFTRKWIRSSLTIQNPLSGTCGAFVLYFILTRLHARNFASCLQLFSNDLYKNDLLMTDFVMKLKKMKVASSP